MDIDISRAVTGGIVASIAWFVAGGALYMNPVAAKIYKDAEASPALKKWPSVPKYVGFQFAGIVAQCLLWAFVFAFVKASLPGALMMKTLAFGLILTAVKIFPRFYDMWIQTTYPNILLGVEFVNGAIGSFIIAGVYAYMI